MAAQDSRGVGSVECHPLGLVPLACCSHQFIVGYARRFLRRLGQLLCLRRSVRPHILIVLQQDNLDVFSAKELLLQVPCTGRHDYGPLPSCRRASRAHTHPAYQVSLSPAAARPPECESGPHTQGTIPCHRAARAESSRAQRQPLPPPRGGLGQPQGRQNATAGAVTQPEGWPLTQSRHQGRHGARFDGTVTSACYTASGHPWGRSFRSSKVLLQLFT